MMPESAYSKAILSLVAKLPCESIRIEGSTLSATGGGMGAIAVGRVERHPRESIPNIGRKNTLTIPAPLPEIDLSIH